MYQPPLKWCLIAKDYLNSPAPFRGFKYPFSTFTGLIRTTFSLFRSALKAALGSTDLLTHHNGHPIAFKMQVDDILQFANAAPAGRDMLEHFPNRCHLQRLADTSIQAICSQGTLLLAVSLLLHARLCLEEENCLFMAAFLSCLLLI